MWQLTCQYRLKNSMPLEIQPVLTIGIVRSERLENDLPSLNIPFIVHLSSHYPASFSNRADRNLLPEHHAGLQQVIPSVGSSCGLLVDDRHSVTLGSYVRLTTAPKKIYILTAPLNIGPSVLVETGNIVTQPSVADRDYLNASEDRYWCDVLKHDPEQTAAVAARRKEQGKSFEFARTVLSASGLQSASKETTMTEGYMQYDTVWDGSQPKKSSFHQSPARASDSWAILEVTRETTAMSFSHVKRRWPWRGRTQKQQAIHPFTPGLLVSKTGRTTGHTTGTVNGARSLYRLPRDGPGVRRYDYPVLSYPWGRAFGLPGDAGAVVLAQQGDGLEDNKVKRKPCALIVASSTRGHVSYAQDMKNIAAGVTRAGLGDMSFIELELLG